MTDSQYAHGQTHASGRAGQISLAESFDIQAAVSAAVPPCMGGCFQCFVVSEAIGGLPWPVGDCGPSSEIQSLLLIMPEAELAELRAALWEKDLTLEQMHTRCNVTRRELENLQRRSRQQISEYEQRLNASRVQCEALRREVDALVRKEENTGAATRIARVSPTMDALPAERDGDEARASGFRVDLRHVFSRIRDRSRVPQAARSKPAIR